MYMISFANSKGGACKSTSTLLMAEQLALAKQRVCVMDCDPNQSVFRWKQTRDKVGKVTPFDVLGLHDEDEMDEIIDKAASSTDYLLFDLEGTASQIVTFAISRSDFCVIPMQCGAEDVRQAVRTSKLVERTAKLIKQHIPFRLLLCRTNAAFQTSDERDVRSEIPDDIVLPVSLVQRAAFGRLFRECHMVGEMEDLAVPSLPQAKINALAYTQAVLDQLNQMESAA